MTPAEFLFLSKLTNQKYSKIVDVDNLYEWAKELCTLTEIDLSDKDSNYLSVNVYPNIAYYSLTRIILQVSKEELLFSQAVDIKKDVKKYLLSLGNKDDTSRIHTNE